MAALWSFLLDRLDVERSILCFPSPLHASEGCSPNTGERKLKNRKSFCGVVGLDGRCSAQAEQRKKPVAVGPLPGAYLSTETNLVPIRGVMKKEFDTGQTDRQTDTRNESAVDRQVPGASAHVTPSKNEKRSAGTCWVSRVKFNHGSTSSR